MRDDGDPPAGTLKRRLDLRIDTSIITQKGGSVARQQEDQLRRDEISKRREARAREQQEREKEQQHSSTMDSVNSSSNGTRGLGIYGDDEDRDLSANRGNGHDAPNQQQQQHDMVQEDNEEDDEDEDDDEEDDDDALSSSPSIPDEHIDFDLVYALHTFLATVEGQASVVKGDSLTLLDDSNSYWWLVRVLKTQAVGYIPAENIETPFERLARLNKHRNVDLAFATSEDHMNGIGSSLAQTRFAQPHHPTNKYLKQTPVQLNPALAGGGRFVDFAPPIYHEHEGFYYSDSAEGEGEYSEYGYDNEEGQGLDEDDDHEDEGSDGSFEGGSAEDLRSHHNMQQQSQEGFDDDDEEEDHDMNDIPEHADDGLQNSLTSRNKDHENSIRYHDDYTHASVEQREALQPLSPGQTGGNFARTAQAQQQAALGVGRPTQVQAAYGGLQTTSPTSEGRGVVRKISIDEQLRMEQEATRPSNQDTTSKAPFTNSQPDVKGGANKANAASASSSISQSRLKPFLHESGELTASTSKHDAAGETRKISLTPRIARDTSQDSNLSDRAWSPAPSNASQNAYNAKQAPRNISGASSNAASGAEQYANSGSAQIPNAGGDYEGSDHFRRGSASSAVTASSMSSSLSGNAAKSDKRSSSPANADTQQQQSKKKKSSGILGGLFSRSKKDKEKEKDKDSKRSNSTSGRKSSASTISDDERASSSGSPAPASPERRNQASAGIVTQQLQQRRAKEAASEVFGTGAALRQQQVEAQNAMFNQYGIHPRSPGDISNVSTFSASRSPSGTQGVGPSSGSMTLSPSTASNMSLLNVGAGSKPRRPGSLIGSPHMSVSASQGGEVPILNVLRVFAGENIHSEATFKTVLLNDSTTTEDLVKQAMQRFRLSPPADAVSTDGTLDTRSLLSEYYLTAKEMNGDETLLEGGQKPLRIFENLAEGSGNFNPTAGLPAVKRSSVGSINSIASNLSMHPSIEKLRMSDFSDDSVVKLFINKRTPDLEHQSLVEDAKGELPERASEDSFQIDASRLSASGSIIDRGPAPGMPTSPLLRFAVRVIIHPQDLPESMTFDPSSPAIIPKATLTERSNRLTASQSVNAVYREKILFFPRNANVSEVVETALDRFGIVEGVVDGGDDIEDKLAKRRSISRVRYSLAVRQSNKETLLGPSGKAIDAYDEPPLFKQYERNSKEFRRRSMETPFNTPSQADIQASDPVFVIRRASHRANHARKASSDTSPVNLLRPPVQPQAVGGISPSTSSRSVYTTPSSELPPELENSVVLQQSPKEIIAAQRAASRANQERTMTSARKNDQAGVDVVLRDSTTIRSSKDSTNTMRYSYIGVDGTETDISKIVESEWKKDVAGTSDSDQEQLTSVPKREVSSALSHATSDSFASALSSPMTPLAPLASGRTIYGTDEDQADADEKAAIMNLNAAPLRIGTTKDYLEEVLDVDGVGNQSQGQIEDRLERVLAQVKNTNASSGVASTLRTQANAPTQSSNARSITDTTDSGRSTPSAIPHPTSDTEQKSLAAATILSRARSGSTGSASTSGRGSPAPQQVSSRSTPQPDAPPSSQSSTPRRMPSKGHHNHTSVASVHSEASTASPATVSTASVAGQATSTPTSSARDESNFAAPLPYREDNGLEFLLRLVDSENTHVKILRHKKPTLLEAIREDPSLQLSQTASQQYEGTRRKVDALEARLDALLIEAMNAQ